MSRIEMPLPDPLVLARKAEITAALADAIGAQDVISDPAETLAYE